VLARAPLDAYVSHAGERDPAGKPVWSRDCVEAHARAPGGARVVVLGNHFISKLGDNDARRRAQAARARAHADALAAADRAALVLVAGDLNDEPASDALAPLLADGAFVDAAAMLPEADAWTWSGSHGHQRLDHVLVPAARGADIAGVSVADGPDVAAASDHRPLVVSPESLRRHRLRGNAPPAVMLVARVPPRRATERQQGRSPGSQPRGSDSETQARRRARPPVAARRASTRSRADMALMCRRRSRSSPGTKPPGAPATRASSPSSAR
jgi:hypothetical protein